MGISIVLQKAFFLKYGYQMGSLDFVGFVLRQTGDGAHDISLVTEDVRGTYAYSKINDLDLLESKTTMRELCIAVDKTYGTFFDDKEYAPGIMTVNSYGHKDDGSADFDDATLRGYFISKSSIMPLDAATLEALVAPMLGTEIYSYADAWLYDGLPEDGIIRGAIEEEWSSSAPSELRKSSFVQRFLARFRKRKFKS
jgi:hypothetical protein